MHRMDTSDSIVTYYEYDSADESDYEINEVCKTSRAVANALTNHRNFVFCSSLGLCHFVFHLNHKNLKIF